MTRPASPTAHNASPTLFYPFVLNDAETELTFHIEYSGLSSAESSAHIHNAGARDEGPVVFILPEGKPEDGVWMITPTDVLYPTTRQLYVSIHTSNYEAGELRGNIREQTVPVRATTWGAVKALFSVQQAARTTAGTLVCLHGITPESECRVPIGFACNICRPLHVLPEYRSDRTPPGGCPFRSLFSVALFDRHSPRAHVARDHRDNPPGPVDCSLSDAGDRRYAGVGRRTTRVRALRFRILTQQ